MSDLPSLEQIAEQQVSGIMENAPADNSIGGAEPVENVELPSAEEIVNETLEQGEGNESNGEEASGSDREAVEAAGESAEEGAEGVAENVEAGEGELSADAGNVEAEPELGSSKFAALARKERAVRERQREYEQRQSQIEQERQRLEQERADFQAKRELLKKTPLKALKELGISYEDVTADALGEYSAKEEDPLDARFKEVDSREDLQALKEEIAEWRKARELQKQQEAAAGIFEDIRTTVSADPSKYEYIQAHGDEGVQLVNDVIIEYFEQHGKILDYSSACDMVEGHYEQYVSEKLLKAEKLRKTLGVTEKSAASPKPAAKPKPAKTLTNSQTTSATNAMPNVDDMDSHDAIEYLSRNWQNFAK